MPPLNRQTEAATEPALPARKPAHARWSNRRADITAALIVAVCAYFYVQINVIAPIPALNGPSDFFGYLKGADDVLHGRSPYNNPAFFYPPLLAFLAIPFAVLDYTTARWVWFVLSHLLLIGAAGLLWRGMGG